MKTNPLLLALLLGIASMISSAGAQVAPEADAWGEAVDGVQMRLALATVVQAALPGELPALAVQIRNQGTNVVVIRPEALRFADIEVDGVWYGPSIIVITGTAMPVVIAPGSQRDISPIRPLASDWHEKDARTIRQLELRPGSHRIRIRNNTELLVNDPKETIERYAPALAERTTEKNVPMLVSNRIVIDVAALPASVRP